MLTHIIITIFRIVKLIMQMFMITIEVICYNTMIVAVNLFKSVMIETVTVEMTIQRQDM